MRVFPGRFSYDDSAGTGATIVAIELHTASDTGFSIRPRPRAVQALKAATGVDLAQHGRDNRPNMSRNGQRPFETGFEAFDRVFDARSETGRTPSLVTAENANTLADRAPEETHLSVNGSILYVLVRGRDLFWPGAVLFATPLTADVIAEAYWKDTQILQETASLAEILVPSN